MGDLVASVGNDFDFSIAIRAGFTRARFPHAGSVIGKGRQSTALILTT
jgi:hypothetical protein